ncbi:MBOAT family protein [soil metagenome]
MLFNSLQFLLFFIAVTSLYFALPHKKRWLLLLLASCWFYIAFIPVYIFILLFTIAIDYIAGIAIEKNSGRKRKMFLIASIVANIGVLVFFKYFNFFSLNAGVLLSQFGLNSDMPVLKIILPIGLSFHTFQALSYTIEVYRGNQKAEKHVGIFALYVLFYPQLVAGPIERPQNMLHQFREVHDFDRQRFRNGILMMSWGILKKVVIADHLALFVDPVYLHPALYSSSEIILATFFFAFQIYFDFSAYSEIAFGAAYLMGFNLMENFRTPYFSKSVSEFWKRWHISLSTWFRDYLYFPLGGNRVSRMRVYVNLMIVFLVSGLWHGAQWGFVIWGGLHGAYLVFAQLRDRLFPKAPSLPVVLQVIIVFLLSWFAWIFFRAGSLSATKSIFKGIMQGSWSIPHFNLAEIIFCFLLIVLISAKEYYYNVYQLTVKRNFFPKIIALAVLIYFFGVFTENQFIYFQF